jgi:hypothetical protein
LKKEKYLLYIAFFLISSNVLILVLRAFKVMSLL